MRHILNNDKQLPFKRPRWYFVKPYAFKLLIVTLFFAVTARSVFIKDMMDLATWSISVYLFLCMYLLLVYIRVIIKVVLHFKWPVFIDPSLKIIGETSYRELVILQFTMARHGSFGADYHQNLVVLVRDKEEKFSTFYIVSEGKYFNELKSFAIENNLYQGNTDEVNNKQKIVGRMQLPDFVYVGQIKVSVQRMRNILDLRELMQYLIFTSIVMLLVFLYLKA
ncbi:hypothetical protein [Chryseobacterium indoltheticum]|uniref:Uncharacterized protein n=1 Tax=Chryseobacterium indoltheticum TaxID=254 RepID=A0A381FQ96_9FLAO|nr:hypothetical protein [Chryseobacterium indoltheticum]SUX48789.1 Uncharacterised protein [Chryseobacterium indoltheticum]